MVFAQRMQEVQDILSRYPDKRSAIMPLLWIAQNEERHISPQAIQEIADILNLHPTEVKETASFYDMYTFEPVGRYVIMICRNISCALCGSDQILDYVAGKLGIAPGQTTPDGKFTLKAVECLGCCADAPMMLVNDTMYNFLTRQKIDQILDGLK
ncbi:MAG: NADH-quinone oxidoreductase subunit NuoE [Candidatus Sumerlaeia bacterium]